VSLSDILIMNAARLVGVLELPGRLKLRVTKGGTENEEFEGVCV
jgi:hypothetical protein